MIARAFALLVAGPFRFLVIGAGALACAAAYATLPAISESESQPLAVAPPGSRAESGVRRSIEDFGFPFTSEIAIVQYDPNGLSPEAQRRAAARAASIDQGEEKARYGGILSAIPIVNTPHVVPGSKQNGTAIVTLLQLSPDLNLYQQYQLARRYASEQAGRPDDHLVGVTGAIPARAVQGDLIDGALPYVEYASVAVIFLLIAIRFRAPGAGLVTLGAAAIAYLLSGHIVAWAAQRYGLSVPIELQPLLVVLVLAVTTDYSVFLLAGARADMERGEKSTVSSRAATARFAPVILVAALTVAGSAASLAVADLEFLRVLGPALGLSVIVSAVVALAFVPAAISSFGRWVLWPGLRQRDGGAEATRPASDPGPVRLAIARLQSIRLAAFGLVGLAILALVFMASGLGRLHMGVSLVDDIPRDTPESRAAQAAGAGFAPGVVSPTEIIVEQRGVGARHDRLVRFEEQVGREPGVAGVIGPREQVPAAAEDVFVAKGGDAARVVVILADDPYSSGAIAAVRHLQADMPTLLGEAGLGGATVTIAGDTAAGAETIDALKASVLPVALLIAGIELALMALLLRALVAPVYLLAASALSAAAPLGLMAYAFTAAGHPDVSYYVPIGVAVLMVSLGADYNLFLAGRIWEHLDERSVGGAIRTAAPRAARSIATAALALSLSFATLAIVPLVSFRAFAFAMAAGALIDSYLVRGQLVPALVSVFGRAGTWPGGGRRAAVERRWRVE